MTHGVVVSPERAAARAGAFALKQGGNAVDAAIAAAFAQGVVNPLLCGLGGTSEMLVYSAKERKLYDIEGKVEVPGRFPEGLFADRVLAQSETIGRYAIEGEDNQIGYPSVMIPGLVRTLGTAFDRFSDHSVPWSQLLLPAMQCAKEGSLLTPYLSGFFGAGPGDFQDRPGYPSLRTKATTSKAGKEFLFPTSESRAVGSYLVQPELFRTLRTLSLEGADAFYTGSIAEHIVGEFEQGNGFLDADDLQDYVCHVTEAALVPIGGSHHLGIGPLPSGGAQLAQMLRLALAAGLPDQHNSSDHVNLIARIMRAVFYDQQNLKVLQPGEDSSVEPYLTEERTQRLLASVRERNAQCPGAAAGTVDGTTHVTTWDEHGNIVSLTHSIGSQAGSGIMSPELGFFYNNFLGHLNPVPGHQDSITPGARLGGLCPSVLFEEGSPTIALGAPGGSRIITSQFQTLLNVLMFGMDLQAAAGQSRCHSEEDSLIHIEADLAEKIGEELEEAGNTLNRSSYMARVEAIALVDGGRLQPGTDPRGGMGVAIV